MAQLINEAKRMQQLAGLITESQLEELDFNQIAMGNNQPPSQPKASFEGKWTDIKDKNEFINKFHISNTSPLVDIVARAIGSNSNYAITNKDGKFYVYTFTQTANPGKPSQAFNSLEDAKKSVKLAESAAPPQQESIEQAVNEALRKLRKQK
jgi:hypothetical protein